MLLNLMFLLYWQLHQCREVATMVWLRRLQIQSEQCLCQALRSTLHPSLAILDLQGPVDLQFHVAEELDFHIVMHESFAFVLFLLVHFL